MRGGMSGKDPDDKARAKLLSELLSAALRAVRAIRPARTPALAEAVGLSLRGYQNFEAGGGALNVEHVMKFGAAIDCDPIGVLAAVHIGRPDFAAYVAQNKAMIAFGMTLQEFVDEAGEAIAFLETTSFVSAYRAAFKDLTGQALEAKARNDALLARAARRGLAGEPEPATVPPLGDEADAVGQVEASLPPPDTEETS